jgi:hypothetical protein
MVRHFFAKLSDFKYDLSRVIRPQVDSRMRAVEDDQAYVTSTDHEYSLLSRTMELTRSRGNWTNTKMFPAKLTYSRPQRRV